MVSIILLPSLVKVGMLVDFKINQDRIAETLCIERFDESSMCSGRCYLSDQIKKANDTERRSSAGNLKHKSEFIWATIPQKQCDVEAGTPFRKAPVPASDIYPGSIHIHEVFHPPRII